MISEVQAPRIVVGGVIRSSDHSRHQEPSISCIVIGPSEVESRRISAAAEMVQRYQGHLRMVGWRNSVGPKYHPGPQTMNHASSGDMTIGECRTDWLMVPEKWCYSICRDGAQVVRRDGAR